MAVRDQYDYNNPTFFNPRGYSQGDNGPGNGPGDGERRMSNKEFQDILANELPELLKSTRANLSDQTLRPELTGEEQSQLDELNQRNERLQPIDLGVNAKSTRIGYNPYSYDISPIISGAASAGQGIFNAVRKKRRQGDAEQYNQAKESQEKAEQALNDLKYDEESDGTRMRRVLDSDEKARAAELTGDIAHYGEQMASSRGVDKPRQLLLKKKLAAQSSRKRLDEMVADVRPKLVDTLFGYAQDKADASNKRETERQRIKNKQEADIAVENVEAGNLTARDAAQAKQDIALEQEKGRQNRETDRRLYGNKENLAKFKAELKDNFGGVVDAITGGKSAQNLGKDGWEAMRRVYELRLQPIQDQIQDQRDILNSDDPLIDEAATQARIVQLNAKAENISQHLLEQQSKALGIPVPDIEKRFKKRPPRQDGASRDSTILNQLRAPLQQPGMQPARSDGTRQHPPQQRIPPQEITDLSDHFNF